jgi:hypothetical protein
MTETLLTDDQQRRVATHLRLLVEDLDALAEDRQLARAEPASVLELVERIRTAAERWRGELGLTADRTPGLRRRVAAVAEIWAMRVEDLKARRLGGYGTVHPSLERQLDPRVEELRGLLIALADAAANLPEEP